MSNLLPVLKWPGGKRWLVSELRLLWDRQAAPRLVEPFVGGMSIALGLRPTQAILNDLNPCLMSFYRHLQSGLHIDTPLVYDKEFYYQMRTRFNELVRLKQTDTKEAATILYYLNKTGFNGLMRFNKKGEFNVPFGRYKSVGYVYDLTEYAPVLKPWVLTQGDFAEVDLRPDDFIYADPPYDVEFTGYNGGGFSWQDQTRLANWLACHTGPVVVSNQATPRIMELYEGLGFSLKTLSARRSISCKGDRPPAVEMLATKGVSRDSDKATNAPVGIPGRFRGQRA